MLLPACPLLESLREPPVLVIGTQAKVLIRSKCAVWRRLEAQSEGYSAAIYAALLKYGIMALYLSLSPWNINACHYIAALS
jgi:hypothetical protein